MSMGTVRDIFNFKSWVPLRASFWIFLFMSLPLMHTEITDSQINFGWNGCQSEELSNHLRHIATKFSNITRLLSIGESNQGNNLWVLMISDSPKHRDRTKPQVKLVGNSLEPCHVILRFMKHLLENYNCVYCPERILIETTEIHILPNLNPDGNQLTVPGVCVGELERIATTATNDANIIRDTSGDSVNCVEHKNQPVAKAVKQWIKSNNFVLSLSFISNPKILSYPFGSFPFNDISANGHTEQMHPDEFIFRHLLSNYIEKVNENLNNTTPSQYWHCPSTTNSLPNGNIIDSECVNFSDTMMDYNYIHGTFEIEVGLFCCSTERNLNNLSEIWLNHRDAMLSAIQEARHGVQGDVMDSNSLEPVFAAQLRCFRQNHSYINSTIRNTTVDGTFWLPLPPGNYTMEIYAPSYKSSARQFQVNSGYGTRIHIDLEKADSPTMTVLEKKTPKDIVMLILCICTVIGVFLGVYIIGVLENLLNSRVNH